MSLLAGKFSLHDVADVEAHVRGTLANYCRKKNWHPPAADADDLIADLVNRAWEASREWDEGKGFRTFSAYLYYKTSRRIIDWKRKQYGDSRYGRGLTKRTLNLDENQDTGAVIEQALLQLDRSNFSPEEWQLFKRVAVPISNRMGTIESMALYYGISKRDLSQRLAAMKTAWKRQAVEST